MTKKTKTFDCVEMKRRIQEGLRAEYESRRKEFPSYAMPLRFFVVKALLAWRK